MTRLFGTDGVRGKAGEYPLDHETVARLGAALVRAMRGEPANARPSAPVHHRPRHARVRRLDRARARPRRPRRGRRDHERRRHPDARRSRTSRARSGFDAGLVISASHNPFDDNGIKVFSGRGEKFSDALEQHVESIIADTSWQVPAGGLPPVERTDVIDAVHRATRAWRCPIPARAARRVQARHRHGERRDDDRRAAAVPRARASTSRRSATSRTAATSTSSAARRIPSASARSCATAATASASRSTATATARSSSITTAASSTATRCC